MHTYSASRMRFIIILYNLPRVARSFTYFYFFSFFPPCFSHKLPPSRTKSILAPILYMKNPYLRSTYMCFQSFFPHLYIVYGVQLTSRARRRSKYFNIIRSQKKSTHTHPNTHIFPYKTRQIKMHLVLWRI